MEAPENLVDAVSRLTPRAILLLDTNAIMDNPRLDSYEISASGRFLLAVPQVVYNEIMSVRLGGKDDRTRQKASRALNVMDKLYERDDPTAGIDLGNDRWLITTKTPPKPRDSNSVEDEQVLGNLGRVDAALLRLAAACTKDFPDTSTLLITRDRNLTRVSTSQGLSACPLSSLRSSETLEQMLPDVQSRETSTIDPSSLLSPEQERPVKIAMTLEGLRSERENLIARGSGQLTYEEERFPFRWTFPFRNLDVTTEDEFHEHVDGSVMPLENLDFMGADEKIPEGVRRLACDMLEDSSGWTTKSLQSAPALIRSEIWFDTGMDCLYGGFYRPSAWIHKKQLTEEQAERYDELSIEHDRLMQTLLDGTAKSVGRTYRSAHKLNQELHELLAWELKFDPDAGPYDLESALIDFLDSTLSTWSVGETAEREYTYRPFGWLEDGEEEAIVDDGKEEGET